jgi:hypothetical protein
MKLLANQKNIDRITIEQSSDRNLKSKLKLNARKNNKIRRPKTL